MATAESILMRPPEQVLRPEWMGAVRLTRYSFNRMLIRRAFADGWQIDQVSADLDAEGRGEVVFRIVADGRSFHFVAFTTTIDESEHTDRVIAGRWEVTATLTEGELTEDLLSMLRREVPLQERGRLDHRVLTLTRGNRSVRFFQYLVDTLAAGRQPDPGLVADAGYIMRSTAFYGNGKFGMRSFEGCEPDHPLAAPYRSQMLCAWLFREMSYLVVEHCARVKGGDRAVPFGEGWDRFFGLGNATGLGLVPYAFKHPAIIDAWVRVREQTLADVRTMAPTDERLALLRLWIDRVRRHFATGTDDDCSPFLNGAAFGPIADRVAQEFERWCVDADADAEADSADRPFDHLYQWAESQGPEVAELVVSLLSELHEGDDREVDAGYVVNESSVVDPDMSVAELRERLEPFRWVDELDLEHGEADWNWWLISDNTDEPRRAPRSAIDPDHRDVAIDVAHCIGRMSEALDRYPNDATIGEFLQAEPRHRLAVRRVMVHWPYGEPRDNVCARNYMPLMVQRFQLATYGMDNYKPKSTDWLRVTLYQGAPRIAELADFSNSGDNDSSANNSVDGVAAIDRWPWPERPKLND